MTQENMVNSVLFDSDEISDTAIDTVAITTEYE